MELTTVAAAEVVDFAGDVGEFDESFEVGGWDELSEGARSDELASELGSVAEVEGWSFDELHFAMDESLGISPLETEPLIGSNGEVVDMLRPEEKAHYDGIGLKPESVNGREALVRDDIDWDAIDAYGQTNLERAEQGYAPLDANGNPIELHHVQQRNDGVLAELTVEEHRGRDIDGLLHDRLGKSEIDRKGWPDVRAAHWQERAQAVREMRGMA